MKRLLIPLIFALTIPISVKAEVDPKVHKLCLPAADYAGCIKAHTTKSTDIPSLRLIEGKTELSGNSCPNGFAYAGAGKCREIKVLAGGTLTMPAFAAMTFGNSAIDAIGLWRSGMTGKPKDNRLGQFDEVIKATYDPKCPDKEPYFYTNSSYDKKPTPPSAEEIKYFFKGPAFTNKKELFEYWDNALEKLYGVKGLATDARYGKNNLSNKEVYSGAVKINCDSPVWKNKPRCN